MEAEAAEVATGAAVMDHRQGRSRQLLGPEQAEQVPVVQAVDRQGQQQALDDVLLEVPSDRVLPVEERLVVVDDRTHNKYIVEDTADYNVVGPRRHRLAGRMNASPYGAALAEKRMKRKY